MRWRTSLFTKHLTSFGLVLMLIAVLAAVAYRSFSQFSALTDEIVSGPIATKNHALLAESELRRATALEQRFLIHLDTKDVQMFKAAIDTAKSHVWIILTSDSLSLDTNTIRIKRKAAELERSIDQYFQGFSDIVWEISLRTQKHEMSFVDIVQTDTTIQQTFKSYSAKAERCGVLAKEICEISDRKLSAVSLQMHHTRDHAIKIFLLITAFTLLAGLLISFLFSRMLTRTILLLHDAAGQVAGGLRTVRLDIRTGDELEDLAASFNTMVENLDVMFKEIEVMFVELEDKSLELATAGEQNKALLLNVLPASIAERLKSGETLIADEHRAATILFADIIGFTELAAVHSAVEIVQMLNMLFSIFDMLSEDCGVEKIKTIGDNYMAACGIPTARENHIEAVADMALAMIPEIKGFAALSGVPLELRIGVHTGNVVAGVIGQKKFIYDLWGDTVNTASRMESSGEAGRIHVSEEVYLALRHSHTFEERGEMEIKGKGLMRTYFLTGKR
ncbi:MAG: HAMP domain-containing protein [Ignavibacteria bacterium]|nr:HAMP domain-containing protein [Ignavibacteria bacterium]